MPERVGDVRDSLGFPRSSDDWPQTIAIGGLLTLFSVLIVPIILLVGYLVRVLRVGMDGEGAPSFENWKSLAGDGGRATAIGLAYTVSIGLVTTILAVVVSAPGGDLGALLVWLVAFVGTTATAYVTPAAVANYAEDGSLRAGFAVGDLRAVLSTKAYARVWLSVIAIVTLAAVAAGLIGIVPLLGALAAPFVQFYGAMAACYHLGNRWNDVFEPATSANQSTTGRATSARSAAAPSTAADAPAPTETATAGGNDGSTASETDARRGIQPTIGETASAAAIAEKPSDRLDAVDAAILVEKLDAADAETVAAATQALADVARTRPELVADAGAVSRLRDLRVSESRAVTEAATRAIGHLDDAGLY